MYIRTYKKKKGDRKLYSIEQSRDLIQYCWAGLFSSTLLWCIQQWLFPLLLDGTKTAWMFYYCKGSRWISSSWCFLAYLLERGCGDNASHANDLESDAWANKCFMCLCKDKTWRLHTDCVPGLAWGLKMQTNDVQDSPALHQHEISHIWTQSWLSCSKSQLNA